jgi:uncharacterized protein YheU (UPF0270 family)
MDIDEYIEVPPQQLDADILTAIIEEFVNREGTDYGLAEYSLEQKVAQVKRQIDQGKVVIAFDAVTESCTLLLKD